MKASDILIKVNETPSRRSTRADSRVNQLLCRVPVGGPRFVVRRDAAEVTVMVTRSTVRRDVIPVELRAWGFTAGT
jgi:hypothetical protein